MGHLALLGDAVPFPLAECSSQARLVRLPSGRQAMATCSCRLTNETWCRCVRPHTMTCCNDAGSIMT